MDVFIPVWFLSSVRPTFRLTCSLAQNIAIFNIDEEVAQW